MSVIIRDKTAPANQLAVNTDGSINVNSAVKTGSNQIAVASDGSQLTVIRDKTTPANQLLVNSDGSLLAAIKSLIIAADGSINTTVRDKTTPANQLVVNSDGSVNTNTAVKTGANALGIATDGSLLVALRDKTTSANQLGIASDGSILTLLRDATTGANLLKINSDGSLQTIIQSMTPPAITKGTQGSTGFTVQPLRDAGRVAICWNTTGFNSTSVAETMITMSESRDGATATTFTSKVITSGKRLRITSINMFALATGSAPTLSRVNFFCRLNTAGAVTAGVGAYQFGSSVVVPAGVGSQSPTQQIDIPDGIEYLGDGTKQIGFSILAPTWATGTNIPQIFVTIFAFEY